MNNASKLQVIEDLDKLLDKHEETLKELKILTTMFDEFIYGVPVTRKLVEIPKDEDPF